MEIEKLIGTALLAFLIFFLSKRAREDRKNKRILKELKEQEENERRRNQWEEQERKKAEEETNRAEAEFSSIIYRLEELIKFFNPIEFDMFFNKQPIEIKEEFIKRTNYNTRSEFKEYLLEQPQEIQKEWAEKDWEQQKKKLSEWKQIKWNLKEELKKNERVGYIYVFKNKAFPDLLKIGCTLRHPQERAKELSRPTGVPYDFEAIYDVKTVDPKKKEALIHKSLSKHRIPKTEFFNVSFGEAADAIDKVVKPTK